MIHTWGWTGATHEICLLTQSSSRPKWSFHVFSGELPQPRPGFQLSEPNGCSTSLVGFQVNAAVGCLFIAPTAFKAISLTTLMAVKATCSVWADCTDTIYLWQLDLGIPAMTKCCNQLDMCYENCGTSKYDCDSRFRSCLHGICSDLKKSLGFVSKVQGEIFNFPLFLPVHSHKLSKKKK